MHTPSSERPFIIRPVPGMYFTTYNRDMGEITMEPAYRGIEEETVTRLPSKAFDEFLKALDRPVPQTARCRRPPGTLSAWSPIGYEVRVPA